MSAALTPEQASALRALLDQHTNPDPALLDLLPADPRLSWSSPSRETSAVTPNIWFNATIEPRAAGFVQVNIPQQNMDSAACIATAVALLDAAAGLEGWSARVCLGSDRATDYRIAKSALARIRL